MSFKILIVDDNVVIRRMLRTSLEQTPGWEVCGEAENGKVAVDKVTELKPDVVILDWQMPVMNGLEAARRIGRDAPDTAMVMLTLHNSEYLEQEARAAGVRHVHSKTGRLEELNTSLRSLCRAAAA